MSEKWTKGPWRISADSPTIIKKDYRRIGSDDGELIASACGIDGSGFFPSDEEAKHNAHLIAAAPEMYEALEKLVKLVKAIREDEYEVDSLTTQPGELALKKARGEG